MALPDQLHSQLDLPGAVALTRDETEVRGREVRYRRSEHCPVKRIGHLDSELIRYPLAEPGVLDNAERFVDIERLTNGQVHRSVPEREGTRVGERRSVQIRITARVEVIRLRSTQGSAREVRPQTAVRS